MTTLADAHDFYINKARAAGRTIVSFKVPCCQQPIETLAAGPNERWDTLATCQHCGRTYMKITTHLTVTGYRI